MSEAFEIKIYTPVGLIVQDTAHSVLLPGHEGELGLLPQHMKYVSVLGTGVLEYVVASSHEVRRMVISSGFCSFSNETLLILTDSVDMPDAVDIDSYVAEREELLSFISAGHFEDPERVQAREKVKHIAALEKLVEN